MDSKPANFAKRLASRCLVGAAAVGVATALACVHNDASIFIGGVLFPPIAVAGAECAYTGSATSPFLSRGTFDVGLANRYEPKVLLGNQLAARGDQTQVRAETARFIAQGATVRLTDAAGGEITSYTVQLAAQVEPASGSAASYAYFGVTLVDSDTVALLRKALTLRGPSKRVVAYFKVFGQTLGGESVESSEYQFPIDTCLGCLVAFTGQPCGGGGAASTTQAVACTAGQDQYQDSCLCAALAVCK